MKGINAFPLQWPAGWKRTDPGRRRRSDYRVSFKQARDALVKETRLLGVSRNNIVISSYLMLREDDIPLANQREPEDPGVAVYWTKTRLVQGKEVHQQRVIACDTWRTVRENMRALSLAIGAFRQIERTGASEILDRAFQGFLALPERTGGEPWWVPVLGFATADGLTQDQVNTAYRRFAKTAHPDAGGSKEEWTKLDLARREALAYLGAT